MHAFHDIRVVKLVAKYLLPGPHVRRDPAWIPQQVAFGLVSPLCAAVECTTRGYVRGNLSKCHSDTLHTAEFAMSYETMNTMKMTHSVALRCITRLEIDAGDGDVDMDHPPVDISMCNSLRFVTIFLGLLTRDIIWPDHCLEFVTLHGNVSALPTQCRGLRLKVYRRVHFKKPIPMLQELYVNDMSASHYKFSPTFAPGVLPALHTFAAVSSADVHLPDSPNLVRLEVESIRSWIPHIPNTVRTLSWMVSPRNVDELLDSVPRDVETLRLEFNHCGYCLDLSGRLFPRLRALSVEQKIQGELKTHLLLHPDTLARLHTFTLKGVHFHLGMAFPRFMRRLHLENVVFSPDTFFPSMVQHMVILGTPKIMEDQKFDAEISIRRIGKLECYKYHMIGFRSEKVGMLVSDFHILNNSPWCSQFVDTTTPKVMVFDVLFNGVYHTVTPGNKWICPKGSTQSLLNATGNLTTMVRVAPSGPLNFLQGEVHMKTNDELMAVLKQKVWCGVFSIFNIDTHHYSTVFHLQ